MLLLKLFGMNIKGTDELIVDTVKPQSHCLWRNCCRSRVSVLSVASRHSHNASLLICIKLNSAWFCHKTNRCCLTSLEIAKLMSSSCFVELSLSTTLKRKEEFEFIFKCRSFNCKSQNWYNLELSLWLLLFVNLHITLMDVLYVCLLLTGGC